MSTPTPPSNRTNLNTPGCNDRDPLVGVRRTLGLDQLEGLQDADHRPAMVEFRLRSGSWTALPYKSLIEVQLVKSSKWPLTVKFSDRLVRVSGANMEALYLALVQQRAMVVMEQDERHDFGSWGSLQDVVQEQEDRVFIASIEIENRSKQNRLREQE